MIKHIKAILLGAALLLPTAVQAEETVLEYGQACADAIADVPAFNCMDGTVIPITVDGETPDKYTSGMDCDRPSLLPLGNKDGQCVPYSRALLLTDGNAQITALCRQKKIRSEDSYYFDEVDLIAHSVKTGSTCWFQAEAKTDKGLDGRRVPPPNEKTPPEGHPSAMAFWNAPAKTASDNCGHCHDSDPFMYSPFIGQVWEEVPTDPFGWYANDIGEAFQKWAKPNALNTPGNTCTGCHRIGSEFTCNQGMFEAAGDIPPQNGDDWAKTYPGSHWMPPGNFHSESFWNITYRDAIDQLNTCCQNPDAPGCMVEPITGKPGTGS